MRRLLLLLPLLAAACAGPEATGPMLRSPLAVRALDGMKEAAARRDWAALAAAEPGACAGPADAICAESHALRARGCRMLAEAEPARRRRLLDCAVASGQAALASAGATAAEEQAEWRRAQAWSLFRRRQIQPRGAVCPDNAALAELAGRLDPALPEARFLGASAALTAAGLPCLPEAGRCPALTQAVRLLNPAPAGDPAWQSLAAGVRAEARRLACPTS